MLESIHPLAEEVVQQDIEKMIKRGERTICVNPKCFDDCCQGECEDNEEQKEK